MSMRGYFLSIAAVWTAITFIHASQIPRGINIVNNSGARVEVHWVHPSTGERVLQSSPFIHNGASLHLNSFVTHSFEVREMPGKSGKCLGDDQTCRLGYFTVNENDDQSIYIDEELTIKHEDHKTIAKESAGELINDCVADIQKEIEANSLSATDAVEKMKDCVESGVALEVEKANEEIAFQTKIRKEIAEHYENYTCADFELETSEAIDTTTWFSDNDGVTRDVQIMHDRPASKVHVIKNFISAEECKAMEDQARPKLHKATVADGKGGSEYSPNRKAMQAGIKIPWNLEGEGHPLTRLSRRVYDYANHVLDMDIEEFGQEDLMSIQYEGRGEEDETPDRYTPHCDGDCDGTQHKVGTRMATVVMYCTVPSKGGATNFRNSGLHIIPEAGSATFFSYINPETMKMDSGFTEHSGCPVIAGEKKIVTQWIRYGVDNENPWDSFNTLGIKKSAEDAY